MDRLNRFRAAGRHADDLDIRLVLKHPAQHLPRQQLIIYD